MPYTFTLDCGQLNPPTNGTVITPDGTLEGRIAIYEYNDGFMRYGDSQRTCQVGGWSGVAPTCIQQGEFYLITFVTCIFIGYISFEALKS